MVQKLTFRTNMGTLRCYKRLAPIRLTRELYAYYSTMGLT